MQPLVLLLLERGVQGAARTLRLAVAPRRASGTPYLAVAPLAVSGVGHAKPGEPALDSECQSRSFRLSHALRLPTIPMNLISARCVRAA